MPLPRGAVRAAGAPELRDIGVESAVAAGGRGAHFALRTPPLPRPPRNPRPFATFAAQALPPGYAAAAPIFIEQHQPAQSAAVSVAAAAPKSKSRARPLAAEVVGLGPSRRKAPAKKAAAAAEAEGALEPVEPAAEPSPEKPEAAADTEDEAMPARR
jgi:hypothetical protein